VRRPGRTAAAPHSANFVVVKAGALEPQQLIVAPSLQGSPRHLVEFGSNAGETFLGEGQSDRFYGAGGNDDLRGGGGND
jgi:hypothetical protein